MTKLTKAQEGLLTYVQNRAERDGKKGRIEVRGNDLRVARALEEKGCLVTGIETRVWKGRVFSWYYAELPE